MFKGWKNCTGEGIHNARTDFSGEATQDRNLQVNRPSTPLPYTTATGFPH
jgi:hypothetical protein